MTSQRRHNHDRTQNRRFPRNYKQKLKFCLKVLIIKISQGFWLIGEGKNGCTPVKTVSIFVTKQNKTKQKRNFRVFIIISIGQVFLQDYIIHSYTSDGKPSCGCLPARLFAD